MRSRTLLARAACVLAPACSPLTAPVDRAEPGPASAVAAGGPGDPGKSASDRDALEIPLPDCPALVNEAWPHYCSEDGKLVGQWMMVDLLRLPDDVVILFDRSGPEAPPRPSLRVATRGDKLYLRLVTCAACRRVLGRGFVGRPAHMSVEQVRQLQGVLGLPADVPPLTSIAAWVEFCRSDTGTQALAQTLLHGWDQPGTP